MTATMMDELQCLILWKAWHHTNDLGTETCLNYRTNMKINNVSVNFIH